MTRRHHINGEERHRIEQHLAAEWASDRSVAFAYLYGSFAESRPFHDIDVGVYLRSISADRAQIPVDVRTLNVAPVSFLYHVLRGQLIFCRDDGLP